MPRLLCYWLMLVVNSLKRNSWSINLANLGRHAQLTRCFSAVAELLVCHIISPTTWRNDMTNKKLSYRRETARQLRMST